MSDENKFPSMRLRRLRQSPEVRELFAETRLSLDDLVYPIFVDEGSAERIEISSMPGVDRIPEAQLEEEVRAVAAEGIRSVILFGVSTAKDGTGSDACNPDGLLARMIRKAKQAAPSMVVIADICFCEYTTHGHCGVVVDGHVDNDQTLSNLASQAVVAADAGADIIAPSAMMDGQVMAIRRALRDAGHEDSIIMSYSTKFASAFFGPFRTATDCNLSGDRKEYQLDPRNRRQAIRESLTDVAEGADVLMVKPGLPGLDVLSQLRDLTELPLAVYQVSGEYAMIKYAAEAGAIDEKSVAIESLLAFKRAGADLIITYFARDVVGWLNSNDVRK